MKIKELKNTRTKDLKTIEALLAKKRLEMSKIQVKILSGKEKNLKTMKFAKKEVAQLLTLIKEKKLISKIEDGKEKSMEKTDKKKGSK